MSKSFRFGLRVGMWLNRKITIIFYNYLCPIFIQKWEQNLFLMLTSLILTDKQTRIQPLFHFGIIPCFIAQISVCFKQMQNLYIRRNCIFRECSMKTTFIKEIAYSEKVCQIKMHTKVHIIFVLFLY